MNISNSVSVRIGRNGETGGKKIMASSFVFMVMNVRPRPIVNI